MFAGRKCAFLLEQRTGDVRQILMRQCISRGDPEWAKISAAPFGPQNLTEVADYESFACNKPISSRPLDLREMHRTYQSDVGSSPGCDSGRDDSAH